MNKMPKLILFNKPFGVLSQFRTDDNNDFATLSDYFTDKSLRVAGRLDATSEGLLLLTNDGQVNQSLTAPPKVLNQKNSKIIKQGKTYWVQLDGMATDEQITQLQNGVLLKDGLTLPAVVERLDDMQLAKLWQAPEGVAKRKIISWLSITIFEGKNRQVRRMTAHVGLPCLRLVRVASSGFDIFNPALAVGEWREIVLSDKDLANLSISSAVFPTKKIAKSLSVTKRLTKTTSNFPNKNPPFKNKSKP